MKKTILITAYAVNPFKGSEDGTGWNIIRHLAPHNNIVAITRHNNRADIERYFAQHPLQQGEQLRFEYFDLPAWLTFWKKGGRGALLYHYLWHLGVVFFIRRKKWNFDIAHHLNFHSDWSPTFLWLLGKPYVWGPLGHHHKIPRSYILPYGWGAWLKDRLMWIVKKLFWSFDPLLLVSKCLATKVIGVNSSVPRMLGLPPEKQCIIPAVATEAPACLPIENDKFRVLAIGRFVPLKGFDVTIRAFARCYLEQPPSYREKMELLLIGKGPEKERLEKIAAGYDLPDGAIRFIEWLNRDALSRYFATSKVFFFPSHEGAGMVIPEALSYSLPVLCFDNYGPGENVDESCAIKIPYSSYGQSIEAFAGALEQLLHYPKKRNRLSKNAFKYYMKNFTWKEKAKRIQAIYDEIKSDCPLPSPASCLSVGNNTLSPCQVHSKQ